MRERTCLKPAAGFQLGDGNGEDGSCDKIAARGAARGIFRDADRCREGWRVKDGELTDRIVALLPRLRRFSLTLTRQEAEADDLVQATVERALTRLGSWKEDSRLDSWMFKIMQNLWIDQTRANRSRGVQAAAGELAALPGVDGRTIMDARMKLRTTLDAAMRLPEEQRAVLALIVVEGLSYAEAAEVLDVPVGTVMSRLSRARLAVSRETTADVHALRLSRVR